MAIEPKLLEELHARQEVARLAGGADHQAKHRQRGQLKPREPRATFFQPTTSQDIGMSAQQLGRAA